MPPKEKETLVERLIHGLSRQPFWGAFVVSGTFLFLSLVYIIVSDHITLDMVKDAEELAYIQTHKGIWYVSSVGIIGFALVYFFLREVEKSRRNNLSRSMALISAEKLATAGTMAASTAHDINNLLTGLNMHLEMNKLSGKDSADDILENIVNEVSRLTSQLMKAVNDVEENDWKDLEFRALIDDITKNVNLHPASKNCSIEYRVPDDIGIITTLPVPFRQMLVNLILNACDATGKNGKILLKAWKVHGELFVSVEDNGPGIPPEDQGRIFKECFTTKKTGHGLGLLSVNASLNLLRGSIAYQQSQWGGAKFICRLPTNKPVEDMSAAI